MNPDSRFQSEARVSLEPYLPHFFGQSYPDRSVEYAVAYALRKAGVEKLEFSSYGPHRTRKIGLTSLTATPGVRCNNSTLLITLLRYYGFGVGGGASFDKRSSYMQASFVYRATAPVYKNGRHIHSTSEGEFLTRVYATFYWLKENPDLIS